MIQPLKLDSSTISREPSQGDARDGGFSSMLAGMVKPTASQSRPQERSEAPLRREKPQEATKTEATSTPKRPQAPEEEQAPTKASAPTTTKPPTRTSKPRDAAKPSESDTEKAEPSDPSTISAPEPRAAIAQLPVELPKPAQSGVAPLQPAPPSTEATAQTTPTKLDSPAISRDGEFSNMLVGMVKPTASQSKPREADKQSADNIKKAEQTEPSAIPAPTAQVAIAQLPIELPKPVQPAVAPSSEPATAVPAPPAAMAPLPPAPPSTEATAQATPASEQEAEPSEEHPAVDPSPANPLPPEASPLVTLLATPPPAQASPVAVEAAKPKAGSIQAQAPTKPAPSPQAMANPSTAPKPVQENGKTEEAAAEPQELKGKKTSATAIAEAIREPAQGSLKADPDKEAPTTQTAEAALGLKPPGPKPALTEFLNRPGPAMETPSVIQVIQEARTSNPPPAAPGFTGLPGIEPSQGSERFQGRESNGGQGARSQAQAQASPVAPVSAGFTLSAPTFDPAKASIPEPAATRPSLPMEQMEGTVRWALKNQQNTAELELRPESLGKVQIQLKVEGNQVHAKVWASEPSTVPLLESHRGMLESSLREQGLSLGSFDLRQGQGSPRHPMEQGTGQASFAGSALDISRDLKLETPAPMAHATLDPRRVEVFA